MVLSRHSFTCLSYWCGEVSRKNVLVTITFIVTTFTTQVCLAGAFNWMTINSLEHHFEVLERAQALCHLLLGFKTLLYYLHLYLRWHNEDKNVVRLGLRWYSQFIQKLCYLTKNIKKIAKKLSIVLLACKYQYPFHPNSCP